MLGRLYDATWGRGFAALYDRALSRVEEGGLREERHALLARANGRVLELGAGTGLNLDHYPRSLKRLVLTEPDPHMAKRLRAHAAEAGVNAEIVEAPGEQLPFEDDSFDTVVSTLVLCTVPDLSGTLAEIARVLKKGGRLLFIEHVRSEDERLARWQDRLHGPWKFIGKGCNCNRDTLSAIRAWLEVEDARHGELPASPPLTRPKIFGSARATA